MRSQSLNFTPARSRRPSRHIDTCSTQPRKSPRRIRAVPPPWRLPPRMMTSYGAIARAQMMPCSSTSFHCRRHRAPDTAIAAHLQGLRLLPASSRKVASLVRCTSCRAQKSVLPQCRVQCEDVQFRQAGHRSPPQQGEYPSQSLTQSHAFAG